METPSKFKIDFIENISFETLVDLLKSIVKGIGYSDIDITTNIISGAFTTPLGSDRHIFVISNERLSGKETQAIKGFAGKTKEIASQFNSSVIYIVSKLHISNGFQDELKRNSDSLDLRFIDRDKVIALVDQYQPEFWKHDDVGLIEYEKAFFDFIANESDLKKLKIFNDKYQKLLDIFVEPSIFHISISKESRPVRSKVSIDQILSLGKPALISGNAGAGKSTVLKRIGEKLINKNSENLLKNLPVFLTVVDIYNAGYNIESLLNLKLQEFFKKSLLEIIPDYKITLLIDTIDELEEEHQNNILKYLKGLYDEHKIIYLLGTRNMEKISTQSNESPINFFFIEKFNNEQIKLFVSKFFSNQESRAEKLLDALRENRILERLPITPLSLSLISILYEENDLEIPATVTDIYDNFNSLLLGKSTVSTRIEFIDISFRERILSIYALALLRKREHAPMSIPEFTSFFQAYYLNKTLPIRKGTLDDVLDYIIKNTGILRIQDGKYVQFSHSSFMEYYGAVEIFKHQRESEKELIENFFDANWQNTAVFYAGRSKDMPGFLSEIIKTLQKEQTLNKSLMGVIGVGYLLQALFQTDNVLRKEAILTALSINTDIYEIFKKLASDDFVLFKRLSLPILGLMNILYFYENFNSITLKQPLKLAFAELINKYKLDSKDSTSGYKALNIALTLNSKRINEETELSELIMDTDLLDNPNLALLADFSVEVFKANNYNELKKAIRKDYHKLADPVKQLTELPAGRLRFTNFDQIKSSKKIKVFTEGKHDAEILEHAYMTLTGGFLPYWSIKPAGNNDTGGASELNKLLENSKPILDAQDVFIGIFDHDSKGLSQFKGLRNFENITDNIRKHKTAEIYAIVLPIPDDLKMYELSQQELNYFEIEHYFDSALLSKNNMLKPTPIPNIFSITDSNKKEFSKEIRKLTSPEYFVKFIELFKLIDDITKAEIQYE